MPRDFSEEIGADNAKVVTLNIWPEPTPLPGGLLPVDAFDIDLLPASLRPWVHGARAGAPKGEGNGQWKHGGDAREAVELRRQASRLLKQIRSEAHA